MNRFVGTRVEIVEEGFVLWDNGRPWQVRHDYPVVQGDVAYSTLEGYQDTLVSLGYLGHVASRYVH